MSGLLIDQLPRSATHVIPIGVSVGRIHASLERAQGQHRHRPPLLIQDTSQVRSGVLILHQSPCRAAPLCSLKQRCQRHCQSKSRRHQECRPVMEGMQTRYYVRIWNARKVARHRAWSRVTIVCHCSSDWYSQTFGRLPKNL